MLPYSQSDGIISHGCDQEHTTSLRLFVYSRWYGSTILATNAAAASALLIRRFSGGVFSRFMLYYSVRNYNERFDYIYEFKWYLYFRTKKTFF